MKIKSASSSLLALAVTLGLSAPRARGRSARQLLERRTLPLARRRRQHPLQPRPGRPRSAGQRRGGRRGGQRIRRVGRRPDFDRHLRPRRPLPVDVDITNFVPYLDPVAPDGLSAIVFDDTGEIFDLLFGPGSGILGFAGPEWVDPTTCTILEGVSFLNGPSFGDATEALDVMVHEFGHYTNLAHTAVNGQIFLVGDTAALRRTTRSATRCRHADRDHVSVLLRRRLGHGDAARATTSRASRRCIRSRRSSPTTATITGTIFALQRHDAAERRQRHRPQRRRTPSTTRCRPCPATSPTTPRQADPLVGTYTLRGLTPGAQLRRLRRPDPGRRLQHAAAQPARVEEFHNGATESNNVTSARRPHGVHAGLRGRRRHRDRRQRHLQHLRARRPAAGRRRRLRGALPAVHLQGLRPGRSTRCSSTPTAASPSALPAPTSPSRSSTVGGLGGPARSGSAADRRPVGRPQPPAGGTVSFSQTANTFTVTWDAVPEFLATGTNTFSITLKRSANHASVEYGDLSALDGLAGVACGSFVTSGFENEQDLRRHHGHRTVNLNGETAAFEIFTAPTTTSPPPAHLRQLQERPSTTRSRARRQQRHRPCRAHPAALQTPRRASSRR